MLREIHDQTQADPRAQCITGYNFRMHCRVRRGLLLLIMLTFCAACDRTMADDPADFEFFEKQIRPLLVTHCNECHANGERNGGLSLESRSAILLGGDSGPAAVSGQPDQSLLIEAIRYGNADLQMPPDGKLPEAEIKRLTEWVAKGLPDPRQPGKPTGNSPTGMSVEDGRRFWSFQPVADPEVPAGTNQADWVQNEIDAFIAQRLGAEGIKPAPRADRRILLRRVTFDLTGLPPTPSEMNQFLADDSPDAFIRVVDRLLASPQYGIRWGRHWLDVARYADSNGLDENLAYGHAWRYRDYVVDAFNSNKPFNRFVIEQIAGDLLPEATRESRSATAFLVLGAKVLAEPDKEKLFMDTIDEQLDTMGKAFLGLTLGCARCHDHKFDPIKQSDYYSLAAILKSTRSFADSQTGVIKHWYEYSFADPNEQERIKQIESEISRRNSAASSFRNKAITRIRSEARTAAARYLAAAAKLSVTSTLREVQQIAAPGNLHPRILHHCRLHLEYHRDDPFFTAWHQFVSEDRVDEIEAHYQDLFTEAESAWEAGQKADPRVTELQDAELHRARTALMDNSGFLAVPPKPEFAFDAATLEEYYELLEEARRFESAAPDAAGAMGVIDGEIQPQLPIHIRGSHRNLGRPVPREFPEVMRVSEVRPILPSQQSGRLELARWMASTQHPLTARVFVNRIWRWHFGRGLVATTENFGQLGDRPTHPRLLDWLSRHFMESGWSIKDLHRLILCSSTYQMASMHPDDVKLAVKDPENLLLWRFRIQRLDAEQFRDALLNVSGQLEQRMGGKTVPLRNRQFVFNHTSVDHTRYDSLRRAIYLPVIRNNLYPLFEQFDFPNPTMPTGNRHATVVAPQALLLMNAPLVMDAADSFAVSLIRSTRSWENRVDAAYQRAFGRPPEASERKRSIEFVREVASSGLTEASEFSAEDEQRAWSIFCQGLFACNEFLYLR